MEVKSALEIIVRKPRPGELEQLGVFRWPIWECEPSEFQWEYDEKETCYILEGDVTVRGAGQEARFGPGDFVVFPKGLKCTWSVAKKVRKHYNFG